MVKVNLLLFLSSIFGFCWGQNPTADFQVSATACQTQRISITDQSTSADAYSWDFCADDFLTLKDYSSAGTISGISYGTGFSMVEDDGIWRAFALGTLSDKLFRLDFDLGLLNNPVVTDLGDSFNALNFGQSIDLIEQNGEWFAAVTNFDNGAGINLLRFGGDLKSTPTVESLGGFGITGRIWDAKFAKQGDDFFLIFIGRQSNELIRVNFRDSFDNSTTGFVYNHVLTGPSVINGFDIVWTGTEWKILALSSSTDEVYQYTLGANLANAPVEEANYTSVVDKPYRVNIVSEADDFIAIVSGEDAGDVRLFDYNNLSITNPPTQLPHTSISDMIGLQGIRHNGQSLIFGNGLSNQLRRAIFESTCGTNPTYSIDASPNPLQYTNGGTKKIELVVRNNTSGMHDNISKSIQVSSLVAPDIDFTFQNVCVDSPIDFTLQNSSGDLTSANWDFGDGNGSSGETLSHIYTTSGIYEVELTVQAVNACENLIIKSLAIYEKPVASFTSPPGLICTNNEFTFLNTTVDNFDGNLTYQWLVDDVPTSTDRDLLHTFTMGGDKKITLQTAIPGCSSEFIQILTGVGEGPIIDFAVEGVCLNETIQLINASQGDIASYAWDFGDGQTSSEASPTVGYSSAGEYTISLETQGTNGCVSAKSVNHQIFSIPQPNFNIDLPPFSCSGLPTQFNDLTPVLTDSNLESWFWMYGDNGATGSGQAPQHTYALSGLYDVTLQVTSDQGCTNQLTKSVSIAESPVATINNSPACVNTGTELQSSSMTPVVDWEWKVENNFYYTENPSHVFVSPGTYNVNLLVTGENGCLGSSLKQVVVPVPATIDFTSFKKCVGTDAEFYATATDSPDLAARYSWLMNGAEKQGENVTYVFPETGLYEVLLSVTTESGCVYTINKAQTVIENPQANFTYSPGVGAPPLPVQFVNSSANARSYTWYFNDATDATSSLVSPSFTFTEVGDYAVDLVASNDEGCESTISKLIKVALPLLYLSLENFETIEGSNGLLQMRVTLNNQGNVDVQDLPLSVQLNNGTELFEKVPERIPGGESRTLVLSTSLSKTPGLQFLCINLQLENNAPGANEELCLSLEESTIFTTPYPNPAKDILKLEWIADKVEDMTLSVISSFGKEMLSISFTGQQGLNSHTLSTQLWQEGLYFIKVQSPSVERTFRIIIVR